MNPADDPHSAVPSPGALFGADVPFLDLLQIAPIDYAPGVGRFEMTVEERHLRTLGILHGGVTATLLDTAMGMAAGTLAPEGHYVVTVQLNVNFIRPAWQGERLVATGTVKHAGRQTAVALGEIVTNDDVLVATGSATFMFVPYPEKQPPDVLPKQPDDVEPTGHR